MRIVKIIGLIGMLVIFSLLPREIISVLTLLNLYTGLVLFTAWVVYRENSVPRSIIWVFLAMTLGLFITAILYIFIALQTSKGDWQWFWMGKRAPE
jgi:hypothetical protein